MKYTLDWHGYWDLNPDYDSLEGWCHIQLGDSRKFTTRLFILLNPTLSAYCKQKIAV